MLRHTYEEPVVPSRVVILGSGGFVGGASAKRLAAGGIRVLGIPRGDIDLLRADAPVRLAGMLRQDDVLLVTAGRVPVKSNTMLIENLLMMDAICGALGQASVAHVVYISSDAVYADSDRSLTESSRAQPASLHGIMHLAREVMLANAWIGPLCLLRPSLLYGANDTHNGYGPNRFRRLASQGEPIVLFGEGEERRDHVLIDDVAEIIYRVIVHRSTGVLNVATGEVASFREIAEAVSSHFASSVTIGGSPRQGAMPHGGYRSFDPKATYRAFPDFRYTPLVDGLACAHDEARLKVSLETRSRLLNIRS